VCTFWPFSCTEPILINILPVNCEKKEDDSEVYLEKLCCDTLYTPFYTALTQEGYDSSFFAMWGLKIVGINERIKKAWSWLSLLSPI
jgi:hypothetical protein